MAFAFVFYFSLKRNEIIINVRYKLLQNRLFSIIVARNRETVAANHVLN